MMDKLSKLDNNGNNDFLLPIDSSNPDFQFIHIDVYDQFGIACKFEFHQDYPDFFRISEIKCIVPSLDGYNYPLQYQVNITKNCTEINTNDYSFKMDLELTRNPGITKIPYMNSPSKDYIHKFKKKSNGAPSKEFRIDVHIENYPFSFKRFLKLKNITFGQQFCKFYIV